MTLYVLYLAGGVALVGGAFGVAMIAYAVGQAREIPEWPEW